MKKALFPTALVGLALLLLYIPPLIWYKCYFPFPDIPVVASVLIAYFSYFLTTSESETFFRRFFIGVLISSVLFSSDKMVQNDVTALNMFEMFSPILLLAFSISMFTVLTIRRIIRKHA
jgi:hypothetical protein